MYNNYAEAVKASDIGELYERSLSIRYSYPQLLSLAPEQSPINEDKPKKLIERLPVEIWISIIKHLDKQDIHHLIFAFPDFQLLKIVWDAHELKRFKEDLLRQEFIPTIAANYGSRTLFRFSDADFFHRHIEQCCRVAAVYAFFLLGHSQKATSYVVHYDLNTHDVCEVEMDKLLTYMTNRHQAQFLGQDLLSNFRFKKRKLSMSSDEDMSHNRPQYEFDKLEILARQRKHALEDQSKKLVDHYLPGNKHGHGYLSGRWRTFSRDDTMGYRENLLRQIEQDSGTTLCRMAAGKRKVTVSSCDYGLGDNCGDYNDIEHSTVCYNHLIFDFSTHRLVVQQLTGPIPQDLDRSSLLHNCVRTLQNSISQCNPILFYRVNIEKLALAKKGFNHASCQCEFPAEVQIEQYSFVDYTYLLHVHLAIGQNSDHVFVLATYGGIAAL